MRKLLELLELLELVTFFCREYQLLFMLFRCTVLMASGHATAMAYRGVSALTDSNEPRCCVCLEDFALTPRAEFVPCSHSVSCLTCVRVMDEVWWNFGRQPIPCPVCRSPIQTVLYCSS